MSFVPLGAFNFITTAHQKLALPPFTVLEYKKPGCWQTVDDTTKQPGPSVQSTHHFQ
jgi:hypothetical protein